MIIRIFAPTPVAKAIAPKLNGQLARHFSLYIRGLQSPRAQQNRALVYCVSLTFLTQKNHSSIEPEGESMPIKYRAARDVKKQVDEIGSDLDFFHVVPQFVFCVRSKGSKAKRTIARIHSLGKIWQGVLNLPPSYTIEVISEIYDKMSKEEKERTLIHELLHIPGSFSGGFRPHKGYVERKTVDQLYKKLQQARSGRKSEPCL